MFSIANRSSEDLGTGSDLPLRRYREHLGNPKNIILK